MTRKLYDEDAYLAVFCARVLSCTREAEGFAVTLDQTAFFPEGGGQSADTGTLGGVPVLDVQQAQGAILHFCAAPLRVGAQVLGQIDWPQRWARMRQHSGEHILSGVVHDMTGYDNVGFHMGADSITVDFSGKLTDAQLVQVQQRANRIVMENRPVRAWYPDAEELASCRYRSKKELDAPVRLVEIRGVDLCACCAPHVRSTGEVGPVLILSRETLRGGTRLEMLSGERASEYILTLQEQSRGISALLSSPPQETFAAVQRLRDEADGTRLLLTQTQRALYDALTEQHRGGKNAVVFLETGDAGKAACAIARGLTGVCAVFAPAEGGFRYALASEKTDVREKNRAMLEALSGRGGGKPNLCQGTVIAAKAEILRFWED